jgi:hypothetical protein
MVNFPLGGNQIRLFLANLLLEACPQKTIRRRVSADSEQPQPEFGLKLTGVDKLNLDSQEELDFITKGFSVLDLEFNFTDEQLKQAKSLFTDHPDAVMPIRNTLQDVADGPECKLIGITAPRAMFTEPTSVAQLDVVQQVEDALKNDRSLHWLTDGGRSKVSYSVLRSLPDLKAQFWHRDYCFADNGVKEMQARELPLFLLVALQEDTYLDFPTGRVYIPKGKAIVVRGDMAHRGVENSQAFMHFRLHVTIEVPESKRLRESRYGDPEFEVANEEQTDNYNRLYSAFLERGRLQALGIVSGDTTGDGGESRCGGDTSGYDGARSHADMEDFPNSEEEQDAVSSCEEQDADVSCKEQQEAGGDTLEEPKTLEVPVFKINTSRWLKEKKREFLNEFGFVVTGPVKSQPFKNACNKVVQHVEENGKSWWNAISLSKAKGGAEMIDFYKRGDMPKELIQPFNVIKQRLEKDYEDLTGKSEMNWSPALLRTPPSPSSVTNFADAQEFHRDYKILHSPPEGVGCHSSIHAFAEPILIVVQLGSHKPDVPPGKFIIIRVDAWCSVWFHGRLVHCGSNQEAYRLFNYNWLKPVTTEIDPTVVQRFLKGVECNAISFEKAQRLLLEYIESADCRPSIRHNKGQSK